MSLSSLSISRPVLATVMSIVIVLFGIIGLYSTGVREYPSVDPPIVSISTPYIGASAEVIESQITEPLEESVNGIAGIRTLTSNSSDGRSFIRVEFDLDVDLETAANDVRDKVSAAMRLLPPDADPPVVTKADADSRPIIFASVRSEQRSLLELNEIAELDLQGATSDHSRRKYGANLGCAQIFNAPLDGSHKTDRFRAYPHGYPQCAFARKCGTAIRTN